ncbi:MAG: hypothetical protein ACRDBQ_18660 [Shewanella sp.]
MESIVVTKSNVKVIPDGGLNIDGKVTLPKSTVHAFIRWTYATSHTSDTWPLVVGQFSLSLDKDEAVSLRKELRKSMLVDDRVSCSTRNLENYRGEDCTVFDYPLRKEHPVTLVLNILNYHLAVWYSAEYPKEWEVPCDMIDAALRVYSPGWSELITVDVVRNPNNFSSSLSYELA